MSLKNIILYHHTKIDLNKLLLKHNFKAQPVDNVLKVKEYFFGGKCIF